MPLKDIYLAYLDCLNRQAWAELDTYVHDNVAHNGRPIGVAGYRAMLVEDFRQIPDLQFKAELLVCDAGLVAARLRFDCSPRDGFLGLSFGGRRMVFAENVFYAFSGRKIREVWSVIDKAEIERQLDAG